MQCDCPRHSSTVSHYINNYYRESDLFKFGNTNAIISTETTIDWFTKYCSDNNIKAFDKISIDSLAAVAMAARMGNTTFLKDLVQRIGLEILNTTDRNYFTALHIVCYEIQPNDTDSIRQACMGAKKLIELGANPNAPAKGGHSPLSISALKVENMPLTSLLIQNHANITSYIYRIINYVPGKGYIQVGSIIKANIDEAERAKVMMKLLYIAKQDADSTLSIFPTEILEVITLLFWQYMAYKE